MAKKRDRKDWREVASVAMVVEALKKDPQCFIDLDGCERMGIEIMEEETEQQRKAKRRRNTQERTKDYWQTNWGRWLLDPRSQIKGTMEYNRFRNRFRMPCELFRGIFMTEIRELKVFPQRYESAIPLEIKAMIGLRILGRGTIIDDIQEMSGVGRSTIHTIFKQFITGIERTMFAKYVTPPTGETLKRVLDTYARLGFPGAVGSVDCTHVYWDKCPKNMKNMCKGKEGAPTLSFELVVDHERRIHSCTQAFVGTTSDKAVVVNDPYCIAIAEGLYRNVKYSVYNEDGTFTTLSGAYLISDNGYTRLWMFQRPSHNACDQRSVYWSEFLESVRKDVECTFGILKARFMFLKHACRYHHMATITAAVRTSCVLHNMLLAWDKGYGEVDWDQFDPDTWERDIHADEGVGAVPRTPPADNTGLSLLPPTLSAPVVKCNLNHHRTLEKLLQIHFEYAYKRGCVVWPKGFSAAARADFPEVTIRENNVLYKAPSHLRAKDADGNHAVDVGLGLYSCIDYKKDDRITEFNGMVRTNEQYEARVQEGKGGYAVRLDAHHVLDCWDKLKVDYGSYANSAVGCRTLQPPPEQDRNGTLYPVHNNCRVTVHTRQGKRRVCLIAAENIPAHRELLWPYGNDYVYPTSVT